jgi:hypothetical protein
MTREGEKTSTLIDRQRNHDCQRTGNKPYSSPTLQLYGALRELTQMPGSGPDTEGASGMAMKILQDRSRRP